MIRKTISLAEIHEKMIADLVAWEGASGDSEIIRRAIINYHRQMAPKPVPKYVEVLRSRETKASPKTPEERAVEEVRKEHAKSELRSSESKERGGIICAALHNSKIITEIDGSLSCKWPTYSMTIPGHVEYGEMKLPFEQLTEDLVEAQFDGDKEAILKIIMHPDESQQTTE